MSEPGSKKQVIVLGAGVVGLTTAVKIQEQGGYDVTIVAEVLPTDPKTIRYTSPWAGATHIPNHWPEGDKRRQMEVDTFNILWEMSKPGSETENLFRRVDQAVYFKPEQSVHPFENMPEFKVIEKDNIPPGFDNGVQFQTITVEPQPYLLYLSDRFTKGGGKIIKASVHHIEQVVEGGPNVYSGEGAASSPDAIIVCTGLGTRFLGGVEDKTMHPVRGQTVIIRAPWVSVGRAGIGADGTLTYVIPRRSGNVILGGTSGVDDWFPRPRPETKQDIVERTLAMCPDIAPPEIREKRVPVVDDILSLVVEEGCGLRPGRTDGVRLEVEWLQACRQNGKKVAIVYSYGHAGYGYQSSWASAEIALNLLQDAMKSV